MNQPLFVIGRISLIAIVGALVYLWFRYRLSLDEDKLARRKQEAKTLIDSFRPELDILIHGDQDAFYILTIEVFKKHESAIRNLMYYLSWFGRWRLKRLCHRLAPFRIDNQAQIQLYYEHYGNNYDYPTKEVRRHLAVERIQAIISFASKQ